MEKEEKLRDLGSKTEEEHHAINTLEKDEVEQKRVEMDEEEKVAAERENEDGCDDDCDEEYSGPGEQEAEKPSKDEYKIAKWMKKNVRTKKTKFLSHNVEYFTSNKTIDALLKSKFAQGVDPLFTTREQVVEFLDVMLEHKFFHRAKKVPVTVEELRSAGGVGGAAKPAKKEKDDKKEGEKATTKKEKDKEKEIIEGDPEAIIADETVTADGEKKEKKKRKIRLDMHPEQVFVDGSEAYVWIYDPIPIHYWIYGLVLLLGAIGICLFPLWPTMLRKGVYYSSVVAAGFLFFILVLAVVRLLVFTAIWALTGGKLHFWIFPNLTEDVGFLASFWPLYESKYVSDLDSKSKSDKRSKGKVQKKKDKDSDVEDDISQDTVSPLEPEKIEEIKEHDAEMELRHRNVVGVGHKSSEVKANRSIDTEEESHSSGGDNSEAAVESDTKCSRTASESDSEISGKDYEIISSSEVQNVN